MARGNNWTHQQRLMQALFSIGPALLQCPPETLPIVLEALGPMVLAKLYCRQAIKLYENAIQKYHSTPGKSKMDGSGE
ncbi:hypothetical protein BGZ99_001358, partial [Dissophora globulifera]